MALRVLFTGGDKLHRGPSTTAPFKLVNIYGPTETTINTTLTDVAAGLMTPPSIGKPVPNMQCYILDPYMQPMPVGVYGELYIGKLLAWLVCVRVRVRACVRVCCIVPLLSILTHPTNSFSL